MPRVLVPLAAGCEELEAVTIVDILRRAGIEVIIAGLVPGPVQASRGVILLPDVELDAVMQQEFDMVVLPGGMPGSIPLTPAWLGPTAPGNMPPVAAPSGIASPGIRPTVAALPAWASNSLP